MGFITLNNSEENIWEINPFLDLISEFKELKRKEGEETSSNILKAIYLIWDPKSDLRESGLPETKLMNDVTESLLGKSFNWDKYDHIREAYMEYNISELEREFLRCGKELKDFNDFLEKWTWTKEGAKERATVMKQYKELISDYVRAKENFIQERTEIEEMEGGYTKSFLENMG